MQENILEQRKKARQNAIKKLRFLIFASIALLLLFLIVAYAALKKGGFSNLLQGDKNPVLNTIENVGETLTGNEGEQEDDSSVYNRDIKVTIVPKPIREQTISQLQNEIVLDEFAGSIDITVKKDSYIKFINSKGTDVSIDIDGLALFRLEDGDLYNVKATNVGVFKFKDVLDTTSSTSHGTIEIIE